MPTHSDKQDTQTNQISGAAVAELRALFTEVAGSCQQQRCFLPDHTCLPAPPAFNPEPDIHVKALRRCVRAATLLPYVCVKGPAG
eukprot:861290-Karenia_brevis.AAC.1